jgi:hypothetical protein
MRLRCEEANHSEVIDAKGSIGNTRLRVEPAERQSGKTRQRGKSRSQPSNDAKVRRAMAHATIVTSSQAPRKNKAIWLRTLILLLLSAGSSAGQSAEPYTFFHEYVGLSDGEIQNIQRGKPVAKIMQSRTPDEVFVFGSVYVNSTPERYLKLVSDIDALRKLPGFLAIRKFSDPPKLSDLDDFTLEEKDVEELKNCRPGHCEIQLPTEAMEEFQRSVNWRAPDHADQVNRLAQKMALDALERYRQGGNAALGTYRDKDHPAQVAETFRSLLSQSKGLPVYMPELQSYLLDYPSAKSDNINSQFYWEKVNFGLKPTLRIVQAIVYRGADPSKPALAVADKQLYASHYFETALDLTVCARDSSKAEQKGFYLITLKGSQQAGLTGFKGSIVRKAAVGKTRSSLESSLRALKQQMEAQAE